MTMTKQFDLWGGSINLEPTEQKVARVLAAFPETRESDKELILKLWMTEDGLADLLRDPALAEQFTQWFRNQATFSESIARMRRKIQSDGRYLSSPEVQRRRDALQEDWRECFRRG